MLPTNQKIYKNNIDQELFKLLNDFGFAKIFKHEHKNILIVKYAENSVIGLIEAKQIVDFVLKNRDLDKPLYGITDASKGATITDEAREFFANDKLSQEETQFMAVVYHQLAQRLLITLYLKFNKPKTPIKIFKTINNALRYLESIGA